MSLTQLKTLSFQLEVHMNIKKTLKKKMVQVKAKKEITSKQIIKKLFQTVMNSLLKLLMTSYQFQKTLLSLYTMIIMVSMSQPLLMFHLKQPSTSTIVDLKTTILFQRLYQRHLTLMENLQV